MKQYTVNISARAVADMEEIYNYIAGQLQAPETAVRQYNRIAAAIESLDLFPERTPVLPEINLHRLLVDNYSVFCFIKLQQVFVVSVLYSSMDIAKRFQNL